MINSLWRSTADCDDDDDDDESAKTASRKPYVSFLAVYDKTSRATSVVTDIVDSCDTVKTVITISYNLYFYRECCAGGSGLATIMIVPS